MEEANFLAVLSGAMLIGSYVAGSLPLLFNLSKSRLRMVSIFGAGLLVGTALAVIIPEGVEALYSVHTEALPSHPFHDAQRPPDAPVRREADSPRIQPRRAEIPDPVKPAVIGSHHEKNLTDPGRVKRHDHRETDDHHSTEHGRGGIHKKIGLSLVFGFVFMLLVDQISSRTAPRSDRAGRSRLGVSATIGLVVHAAADGIALGSASTINKSDVQLIVFIAIMLHKAPAAFGLVSFLLIENIDHRIIRKHLLIFSLAAPVLAFATFFVIQNNSETLPSSESNTGVLMLFSAGTFLYVATVHVLPELVAHSEVSQDYLLVGDGADSTALGGHVHSGGSFTIKELCSIIVGALVPALLASGHSH